MTNKGRGKRPSVKRPKKERFQKLKEMGCFKQVDRRIRAGYPLIEVARYIHEDREEYLDVKRDSLVAVLSEYRESLPPGDIVKQHMPKSFAKAEERLEQGLDELAEIGEIYMMQKHRVERFIEQDHELGLALPNKVMTLDIQLLMKMLKTSLDMKMDLGMTKRHLGEMAVDTRIMEIARERFGERVAKTLGDPESRRKVIDLVDRIKRKKEKEQEEQMEEAGAEEAES